MKKRTIVAAVVILILIAAGIGFWVSWGETNVAGEAKDLGGTGQVLDASTEPLLHEQTDWYKISASVPEESLDTERMMERYIKTLILESKRNWLSMSSEQLDLVKQSGKLYEITSKYSDLSFSKLGIKNYLFETYYFDGGAEGVTFPETFVFSKDGLVRIEDVIKFEKGVSLTLSKLMRDKLLSANPEKTVQLGNSLSFQYLTSDGVFDFEKCKLDRGGDCGDDIMLENFRHFMVREEGLEVIFDSFILGVKSDGEIQKALLPWSEISVFLNQKFKTSLGL